MRIRLASAFIIALAALLAACGSSVSGAGGDTNTNLPPAGGGGGGGSVGTAVLTWSGPSTNADSSALADLAGYRVYQSTTRGSYTSGPVTTVTGPASGGGTATATVGNLAPGTYYFVVRAYDSSGNESVVSNEVSKTIP